MLFTQAAVMCDPARCDFLANYGKHSQRERIAYRRKVNVPFKSWYSTARKKVEVIGYPDRLTPHHPMNHSSWLIQYDIHARSHLQRVIILKRFPLFPFCNCLITTLFNHEYNSGTTSRLRPQCLKVQWYIHMFVQLLQLLLMFLDLCFELS